MHGLGIGMAVLGSGPQEVERDTGSRAAEGGGMQGRGAVGGDNRGQQLREDVGRPVRLPKAPLPSAFDRGARQPSS